MCYLRDNKKEYDSGNNFIYLDKKYAK